MPAAAAAFAGNRSECFRSTKKETCVIASSAAPRSNLRFRPFRRLRLLNPGIRGAVRGRHRRAGETAVWAKRPRSAQTLSGKAVGHGGKCRGTGFRDHPRGRTISVTPISAKTIERLPSVSGLAGTHARQVGGDRAGPDVRAQNMGESWGQRSPGRFRTHVGDRKRKRGSQRCQGLAPYPKDGTTLVTDLGGKGLPNGKRPGDLVFLRSCFLAFTLARPTDLCVKPTHNFHLQHEERLIMHIEFRHLRTNSGDSRAGGLRAAETIEQSPNQPCRIR